MMNERVIATQATVTHITFVRSFVGVYLEGKRRVRGKTAPATKGIRTRQKMSLEMIDPRELARTERAGLCLRLFGDIASVSRSRERLA